MKYLKIFALSLLVCAASCGSERAYQSAANASSVSSRSTTTSDESLTDAKSAAPAKNAAPNAVVQQNIPLTQDTPVNIDRKIIRNADLQIEADSPQASLEKITAIAEGNGGFVVESQASSSDVKTTEHDVVLMTVRVPSAKFDETLEAIRGTGKRVIQENIKGEDVTEEFIDIEARLKAEKALEAQFIEIMKRANSVDEALSVQRQLADVRGEIEKIEGRKRFLENQASLSTIKIRLETPTAFSANSSGFIYRLGESFAAGFDFALSFVLGLVTLVVALIPVAIIFGLPGYLIVRYFFKRKDRPRSFSEIAKDEIETE